MQLHVLIADPDKMMAQRISGWIDSQGNNFECLHAATGMEAMDYLRSKAVVLLITELILPDIDGFGLLDWVNKECSEVPAIVISAHGKPKTREILLRKGAEEFLPKPVDERLFLSALGKTLQRIQEGGALNGASLDTFAQMIEMEQKTCTLRVLHPPSKGYGILFFSSGNIIHARIPGPKKSDGISAAYTILGWQPVSLMIENHCRAPSETIQADLQGMLMEAMRLKDEEGPQELQPAAQTVLPASTDKSENHAPSTPSTIDSLQQWLQSQSQHDRSLGIQGVYQDASWKELLNYASLIGAAFDAGKLEACYVNTEDASEFLALPDEEATVIAVRPACKREHLVSLLAKKPSFRTSGGVL
ncbi:response regulator [Desulfobotulus sp. H1]|uniref:Response regulator n=1 Tax=Desulfobotulus pelophilus TaxID=2823377 RepID=A0ABT3NCI7_9BACT|nr:response regulator [Desulfobotulus pelophilus]MCW7755130.1 response regulator [Desulfobotulus pelophilus]